MLATLVQIDAWDMATQATIALRACSIDDPAVCHLDGKTWWPAITKLPTLRYDFFDGAFGGQISAPSSTIVIQTEPLPALTAPGLADARLRLWTGDLGADWSGFTLRFDGRVSNQPQAEDGHAQIDFAVDDRWLDTSLLAAYAGTTGAEGAASLKGQPKPLALGAPRYAAGVLIDAVNSVFQVSGYGPIVAFEAALERLLRFGPPMADYPSYDALVAAVIPPGRWATALAVGMARFGAPPNGQISFLVQGDAGGPDGWARKPGQIIRRLALLSGGAGRIDDASLNALDVARPYPQSIYVDAQTTARQLIQQIAASVNAVAGVSWTGKLFVRPIAIEAPTITLSTDGSMLPATRPARQIEMGVPWQKLALGAERAWTVHALADIAFTATLVDMGGYSPATTYREGNIVQYAGSTWLYVNPAPSAGNTPPDLPATSNAYWNALSKGKMDWGDISGKPVTRLYDNILDTTPWVPGATGSVGRFGQNGDTTENSIILDTGPAGISEPIWRMVSQDAAYGGGADPDGGWTYFMTGDADGIDPRETYRLMVWARQGAGATGAFYFGTHTDLSRVQQLDGSDNINPYFWSGDLPQADKWYLLVGVVHGADYAGGDSGVSGVYDPVTGVRVLPGAEFKFPAGATALVHRAFQYYGPVGSTRYFARPYAGRITDASLSIQQMFATVGMTASEKATLSATQAILNAIASDSVIAAGAEKRELARQVNQVQRAYNEANTTSVSISATYGVDATYYERVASDGAYSALINYLNGLSAAWTNTSLDTAVDGGTLNNLFSDVYQKVAGLNAANAAYVQARSKAALDDIERISSDNVLSRVEKSKATLDYSALWNDFQALDARFVVLGSPADIQSARDAAYNARQALDALLLSYNPSWSDLTQDTPIDGAQLRNTWASADSAISTFRAAITGRKGDTGASTFTLVANDANTTVGPNSVTKIAGGADWNAGAWSREKYAGDVMVTGRLASGGHHQMVGLNADNDAGSGYADIDYAAFNAAGVFHVYVSGVHIDEFGPTLAIYQTLYVRRRGSRVEFGVVGESAPRYTHSVGVDPAVPLGADFTLYQVGAKIDSITFQPVGADGRDGLDGDDGLPGAPGANGQTSYVHFAYADSADGSANFTTGAAGGRFYVGTYTDFAPADSANPAAYTWTQLRGIDGANGTPGAPGANGQPSYVHIAYAKSADGQTDFHLSDPTGRTYIGVYTDGTVADSANPAAYTWSLIKGADGTNGQNAIVASLSVTAITVAADSANGTKAGQLPRNSTVALMSGQTDITGAAAVTVTPSDATSIAASYAGGVVSITTANGTGWVDVAAVYNGVSYAQRITIGRTRDPQPPTTPTSASGGGGINNLTSSSYGSYSPTMTLLAPNSNQISVSVTGDYTVASGGTGNRIARVAAKAQYSPAGANSWSDIGAETIGGTATSGPSEPQDATVGGTWTINGLTPGASYDFRFAFRRYSGTGTVSMIYDYSGQQI